MKISLTLLLVFISSSVWAQPIPSEYPIQGRFACTGHDENFTAPGDLGSPLPGSNSGGQNNGFLYVYPSRNVIFDAAEGVWKLEVGVWDGIQYLWFPTEGGQKCAYYPEVLGSLPDPHDWYIGIPDPGPLKNEGRLRCMGYDGILNIPGDAYGGAPNDGILFSLPAKSSHILRGTGWRHMLLTVTNVDNELEDVWAVWHSSMCDYDPSL